MSSAELDNDISLMYTTNITSASTKPSDSLLTTALQDPYEYSQGFQVSKGAACLMLTVLLWEIYAVNPSFSPAEYPQPVDQNYIKYSAVNFRK